MLGLSERFDHVRLHGADSKKAFTIMTTRLLFHTGWRSRDEFALHYSYFQNGSDIVALTGLPPGSVLMQTRSSRRHVVRHLLVVASLS